MPDPPRCPHCGGASLFRDQEGERFCLSCGWREAPEDALPYVRQRAEQDGKRKPSPRRDR